jgi:hypothetical protein
LGAGNKDGEKRSEAASALRVDWDVGVASAAFFFAEGE